MHSNGIITAPIDVISDVSNVLIANNGDVGHLCSNGSGSINKWAKYKPTRYNSVSQPSSVTWKADDGNCGIALKGVFTSRTDIENNISKGTQWEYEPPRPGTDWCRITDFENYWHYATSPFGTVPDQRYIASTGDLSIFCTSPLWQSSDEGRLSLALKDFINPTYNISDWYFGLVLQSDSHTFIATRTTKVSQTSDWSVNFGVTLKNYPGTYKAYPIFSSAVWDPSGSDPSSVKVVGAEVSAGTITIEASQDAYPQRIKCWFAADTTDKKLYYDVSITNNGSNTSQNFSSVILQVAADRNGTGATTAVSFGTVTVAKGATKTWEGSVALSRSDARTYYKFARLSIGNLPNYDWVNLFTDIAPGGPVVVS